MDEKKYVSDNPVLMAEWDWEKNTALNPSELSSGSHIKIWWKCSLGHSWESSVSKRFIGQKCPYCSGKKALKGYNDLSTTNPELVSEWDFQKNDIPASEFRPMSNKKVWWKCKNGHSWEAAISKRVLGEGCPICKGKKILTGYNDLCTTHPALMEEWNYEKNIDINPSSLSKGSTAKVWWKCKRNHSWKSAVYSRTSGCGCPYCAKELQSSYPEKVFYFYIKKVFKDAVSNYHFTELNRFELDVYVPSLKIGIEYDGERWHQSVGKDLEKNKFCANLGITLIRIREPKCPVIDDVSSICIIRDNKKAGLDETIKELFAKISKIIGVEVSTDIDLVKDASKILELVDPVTKENNIFTLYPHLENEWDYAKNGSVLPTTLSFGSDKQVWWICPKGHSYHASVSSRARGRGCPICSGKKVEKGINDIGTTHPEIASEWCKELNSLKAEDVSAGSSKKVWWECSACGFKWETAVYNRCIGKTNCPKCRIKHKKCAE